MMHSQNQRNLMNNLVITMIKHLQISILLNLNSTTFGAKKIQTCACVSCMDEVATVTELSVWMLASCTTELFTGKLGGSVVPVAVLPFCSQGI